MSDEELRRLEREKRASADPVTDARHLRELVRQGRLDAARVEVAAWLGDALAIAASAAAPPAEAPDLRDVVRRLAPFGREAFLRAEIALVRASLGRWRSRFDGPDDETVREVEAFEAWARDPSPANADALSRLRAELEESGDYYGGFGRALSTEPPSIPEERAVALVEGLLDSRFDDRYVRRWLHDELSPWLLGTGDPLSDRPRTHGVRFGREPDIVRAIAFSPDGSLVATTSANGTTTLRPVDRSRPSLARLEDDLYAAAFSPDGARLAVGGRSGTFVVFDITSGVELARHAHGADQVNDLAYLPDGRLVSVGWDGRAKLWRDGEATTLDLHERSINGLAVSPDGRRLATASSDGSVRITDVASGERLAGFGGGGDSVIDVAFARDGESVVAASDHAVSLCERSPDPRVVARFERSITAFAFHPARELVATVAAEWGLTVTTLAGETILRRDAFTGLPLSVAFLPDGSGVLVGERGGALRTFALS